MQKRQGTPRGAANRARGPSTKIIIKSPIVMLFFSKTNPQNWMEIQVCTYIQLSFGRWFFSMIYLHHGKDVWSVAN